MITEEMKHKLLIQQMFVTIKSNNKLDLDYQMNTFILCLNLGKREDFKVVNRNIHKT